MPKSPFPAEKFFSQKQSKAIYSLSILLEKFENIFFGLSIGMCLYLLEIIAATFSDKALYSVTEKSKFTLTSKLISQVNVTATDHTELQHVYMPLLLNYE